MRALVLMALVSELYCTSALPNMRVVSVYVTREPMSVAVTLPYGRSIQFKEKLGSIEKLRTDVHAAAADAKGRLLAIIKAATLERDMAGEQLSMRAQGHACPHTGEVVAADGDGHGRDLERLGQEFVGAAVGDTEAVAVVELDREFPFPSRVSRRPAPFSI